MTLAQLDAAKAMREALEDWQRLALGSKVSTKNPNTTFVDTRDLQAFAAHTVTTLAQWDDTERKDR